MRIVSVGEILWDVIGDTEYLGGAPFNLCAHLVRLGHEPIFVSAVDTDDRGRRALIQAENLKIDTRFINCTSLAPTGISEVILDEAGKATHRLLRPAAYDFASLTPTQRAELSQKRPDWICYGTLAQTESGPQSLTRDLICDHPQAGRFYDVNLRPRSWTPELVEDLFSRCTAVKLNDEEAEILAQVFDWPLDPCARFADAVSARFGTELVCVTRGDGGCALWHRGDYVESPGFTVDVVDTVGSGDAFSAALLHGLHQGWELPHIADFANRVGALVATRPGATPLWTEEEALALARS